MAKTSKKSKVSGCESGAVSVEMAQLVLEIQELTRVRTALSFGTKTGLRDSAESTISRKINSKVALLSTLVLNDHAD